MSTPNYFVLLDHKGRIKALPKDAMSLWIHVGVDDHFTKMVCIGNIIIGETLRKQILWLEILTEEESFGN